MKQKLSLLLVFVFLLTLLTGCGSSAKSNSFAMMEEAAAPEAPAMMAANSAAGALKASGDTGSSAIPENRKWIVTVFLSAETEDLDAMTAALDERITALGGYVEDQNIYNGSAYASRRYRSANLTVRIPAEDVDQFTKEVSGIANIISQEKNLEDITLNYVSTESRVTALQTEEARLLELMAKAETMSDLLEIEQRLTDVRYELENVTTRLRTYDNQIDYATIYLDISEVQEYTPVEDPSLWERITKGVQDSLEGLGESLQDLLVGVIVALPFLVVYGGMILVIVLIVRKLIKRKPKGKKAPRNSTENKEISE